MPKWIIAILVVVVALLGFPLFSQPRSQAPPQEISSEGRSRLIVVEYPQTGSYITSPLEITGEARGTWYFEATFPLVLVNWDGLIIAQGYAEAQDEWMTEEFVPFRGELEFPKPEYGGRGALILQKANPSGLPQFDDAIEIPISFE